MIRLAKPPLPHIVRARAPAPRARPRRGPQPQLLPTWQEKIGLLIPHSRVMENVTDMPILITEACLPDYILDADGGRAALNGGGDLRFSSDLEGQTPLACHIVSFVTANDPANASAEIWVRVPALSSTVDTMIYMWWKKAGMSQPAVGAAAGQYAVYSGLGLSHVFKLEDDQDASVNNNDITHVGLAFNPARFGNGADYTNWISATAPGWGDRIAYTITAWVKIVTQDVFIWKDGVANGGFFDKDPATDRWRIQVQQNFVGPNNGIWQSDYFAGPGWHEVGIAYDGSAVTNDPVVVCDGRVIPMTETSTPAEAAWSLGLLYPGSQAAIAAFLDEFWADTTVRSAGWLLTVARLQMDPVKSVIPCEHHQGGGRGLYRIFNAAKYRLYRKVDEPPIPGTDAPFAEVDTLPATPAVAWADGEWYVSATRFNGVIEGGRYPVGPTGEPYHILTLSGGAAGYTPPQAPYSWALELRPGGIVRIHATYVGSGDAGAGGRADEWAIQYTTDGSAPVPGTPDLTSPMTFAGDVSQLSYDLPAQEDGRTVRVLLRTRRNDGTEGSPVWTYSTNVTSEVAIADVIGPDAPLAADMWRGALPEDL